MNRIYNNFFVLQAVVLLSTALAALSFLDSHLWYGALFILLTIAGSYKLYLLYRQPMKNLGFLLDAIENDDTAVRFSEVNHPPHTLQVNKALNRIAQILYSDKRSIAQREKYYELILDFVDTGIIILGQNGFIYQTNKAALRLLGLPVLTHTSQLSALYSALPNQFNHLSTDDRLQIDLNNGAEAVHLSLRVSSVTLKDEELRIVSLSNINRELDEREVDAWLKLTRVLTHEIMNSLTPVTSISETLLRLPDAKSPEMQQGLDTIATTSKGLINFVNSYRQLTHLPQPNPAVFEVRPFLERMIHLATHQSTFSEVGIFLSRIDDDLMLYADEQLVGQVVTNLLNNALQAIGDNPKGEIHLKAYCDEQQAVLIEVANNGPVISSEEATQIFVPFFTTKPDGCGIGLSLSRQIMRQCGGTLTLSPYRNDKQLTQFTLRFV